MANGISAIEGFTYQAVASLDLTLSHFERFPGGIARPEGNDDLELRYSSGAHESLLVQVKKPRATVDGVLTGEPWTFADVCNELVTSNCGCWATSSRSAAGT